MSHMIVCSLLQGMFPAALQQSHYTHMPRRTPTPTGRSTPQPSEKHPEESSVRAANGQQHLTVYERMLERLNGMFPHYNRCLSSLFLRKAALHMTVVVTFCGCWFPI